MAVTAFSPLGQGQSYAKLGLADISVLSDESVCEIASRLGVSCAQVVLRWGIQRGYSVVPKSENLERIKQNLDLFSFSLNEEDMLRIGKLNRNLRLNDPGYFCPRNFKTECPIWD